MHLYAVVLYENQGCRYIVDNTYIIICIFVLLLFGVGCLFIFIIFHVIHSMKSVQRREWKWKIIYLKNDACASTDILYYYSVPYRPIYIISYLMMWGHIIYYNVGLTNDWRCDEGVIWCPYYIRVWYAGDDDFLCARIKTCIQGVHLYAYYNLPVCSWNMVSWINRRIIRTDRSVWETIISEKLLRLHNILIT